MARKVLDLDGLRALLVLINGLIDQKSQLNMVSTIDKNSTNQQIPGAKAVYDLITAAISGLTILSMEVVPELPLINDAEATVIYLIRVDANTNHYHQWIVSGGEWFDLGITEIDLSNYWSKDELQIMTNAEIQEIFDDVMGV